MNLDDDICYCYHVSLRKLVNFARRTKPRVDSQMSECLGAGTGCGWCIPILRKIVTLTQEGKEFRLDVAPEKYAAARAAYREKGEKRNKFGGKTGPATIPELDDLESTAPDSHSPTDHPRPAASDADEST